MREILFRGKTEKGEWVEGFYYISRASNCPIIYENKKDGGHKYVLPETVGEYTGLPDKNGKEIFEWDIVEIRPDEFYRYVSVVEYKNGMFSITAPDRFEPLKNVQRYARIIGNKFDNPELLEVEK